MNKLYRTFFPTPEEEQEDLQKFNNLMQRAHDEHWCCTCAHYIPVPDNLPGFVTAFPECELGGLATKTCLFYLTSN